MARAPIPMTKAKSSRSVKNGAPFVTLIASVSVDLRSSILFAINTAWSRLTSCVYYNIL